MNWKIEITALALAAAIFGACDPVQHSAQTGPLIEASEVSVMTEDTLPLALIDVRPEAQYLAGHLPGAANFWRTDLENKDTLYGGMALSRSLFEQKLGAAGFTDAHRFVLYDDQGGVEASRVYWLLKRYGLDGMQIMRGGLQAWEGDLETGAPIAAQAEFIFPGKERPEMYISYALFEEWRGREGVRLIDSRSEQEFSGAELKTGAFAAGHIPGAMHCCYSNCVNYSAAPCLKDSAALDVLYARLASREDTVITYCHSGVRSAYVWFVLSEILGYPNVYNYDGSWTEWSYFQSLADRESDRKTKRIK